LALIAPKSTLTRFKGRGVGGNSMIDDMLSPRVADDASCIVSPTVVGLSCGLHMTPHRIDMTLRPGTGCQP
jgi:hypothetical protein